MEKRKKKEFDSSVNAFGIVKRQLETESKPAKKESFDVKALGRKGRLKGSKARLLKKERIKFR